MKRTATALLIAGSFVLMAAPMASAEPGTSETIYHHAPIAFADIQGHFANQAIARLSDLGMIAETGDSFHPNGSIDRTKFKQWVQMATGSIVLDQNADQPYISRVEAAEMIQSAIPALNTGINGNLPYPYTDTTTVTSPQHDALFKLYQEGIMVGDGTGHFSPQAMLTRGEATVLLDKALSGTLEVAKNTDFSTTGQVDQTTITAATGNSQEEGLYSTVVGDTRYVVVQAGSEPTSGYSVTIDSMKETAAGIFVQASLHRPDPGQFQAQHVENPAAYATIKNVEKPLYLYVSDEDLMTAQPN